VTGNEITQVHPSGIACCRRTGANPHWAQTLRDSGTGTTGFGAPADPSDMHAGRRPRSPKHGVLRAAGRGHDRRGPSGVPIGLPAAGPPARRSGSAVPVGVEYGAEALQRVADPRSERAVPVAHRSDTTCHRPVRGGRRLVIQGREDPEFRWAVDEVVQVTRGRGQRRWSWTRLDEDRWLTRPRMARMT
jgi:hypothetical protein